MDAYHPLVDRISKYLGGGLSNPAWMQNPPPQAYPPGGRSLPLDADPLEEAHPLDVDHIRLPTGGRPPRCRPPWRQIPWSCDMWSMLGSIRPRQSPWTKGMIHTYENITLPQTSFAGGKKKHEKANNSAPNLDLTRFITLEKLISLNNFIFHPLV